MRQAGVLSRVLPESERWGIDAIPGLIRAEADLGWTADAMLRLEAIVPPDAERMAALAERLKMSKAEASRLAQWALAKAVAPETTEGAFARLLYGGDEQAFADRLKLDLAAARARAVNHTEELVKAGGYARLLAYLGRWARPVFPLRGSDLLPLGATPGPRLGALLARLEAEWIDGGFMLERDDLLARAEARIGRHE
jgi:tRNA nucleotidyltransferase/poly(A) polymerase